MRRFIDYAKLMKTGKRNVLLDSSFPAVNSLQVSKYTLGNFEAY